MTISIFTILSSNTRVTEKNIRFNLEIISIELKKNL